jgi:hypothetical protein
MSEPDGSCLPTPRASDTNGAGKDRGTTAGLDLRTAIALLPSPSAGNFNDGEDPATWLARRERIKAQGISGNGMGTPLGMAVKLLMPTPTANDYKGAQYQKGPEGKRFLTLPGAAKLLPTPTARDHKDGAPTPNVPVNGLLGREVWQLLPTPRAQNGESRNSRLWIRPDGQPQNLENALARVVLPGGRTSPPRGDGRPSPDQLPLPLTSEDG